MKCTASRTSPHMKTRVTTATRGMPIAQKLEAQSVNNISQMGK
jgi:hypothetical protein